MKNTVKILLSLLLAASLCLSLAACGTSLEGTYVLSAITYEGVTMSGDELKAEYEDLGISLEDTYLELRSDSTGVLCLYGLAMEIGYADGHLWLTEELDLGLDDDFEDLEFDEDGFPIEPTETQEATEATVPEEAKIPFTVDGKNIQIDVDGLGEVLTFTKK